MSANGPRVNILAKANKHPPGIFVKAKLVGSPAIYRQIENTAKVPSL